MFFAVTIFGAGGTLWGGVFGLSGEIHLGLIWLVLGWGVNLCFRNLVLVAFLSSGNLFAALIVNGTVVATQSGPSVSTFTLANILLSDGVALNLSGYSGGRLFDPCGPGCTFTGPYALSFGNTSANRGGGDLLFGSLFFHYTQSFTPAVVDLQTYKIPFTATGSAGANYPPCPYPDDPGGCSIPLTGSGIATITLTGTPFNNVPDQKFYISTASFDFHPVPEPGTGLLVMGVPVGFLLVRRLRRGRRQLPG